MKRKLLLLTGANLILLGSVNAQNTPSDSEGILELNPKKNEYHWESSSFNRTSHCSIPLEVLNSSPICDSGVVNFEISGDSYGHFNWYDDNGWMSYFYDSTFTTNMIYQADTIFVESACPVDTTLINLPAQGSTYTGNTRGYWFVAPKDFAITGLRVPTETGAADQNIEVLRFNTAPPEYATTTNDFVSLAYFNNVAGTNIIDVYIPIHQGDTIGILGVRGNANSYAPGPATVNIDGDNVTITRLGFQDELSTVQAYDVWTEPASSISRVEMYYSTLETSDSLQMIASIQSTPDSTVTQNGFTLTANDSGNVTYQWIDCGSGQPIAGGTSQSFQVTTNGDYAVMVENTACGSVTSECFSFSTINTNEYSDFNFQVYPNPNNGDFSIQSNKKGEISIYNSVGQIVRSLTLNENNAYKVKISDLSEGMYLIHSDFSTIKKVIVTK